MKLQYDKVRKKYIKYEKKMFCVRLPKKMVDRVNKFVKNRQWSSVGLVTALLDDYLEKNK